MERPRLLDGENLPREPLQRRSRRNREQLKQAALALFGEKGYERTSIGDIAGRANVAVGSFYQHFRGKRQLLLVLMDDLLEGLSRLNFRPGNSTDVRESIRAMLARAFSADLQYLGAVRAWQEAALTDERVARSQEKIHQWTTGRAAALFSVLAQSPGARPGLDVPALAQAMDSFFWSLLGRAGALSEGQLQQQIDAATHLIHHALFTDSRGPQGHS